MKNLPRSRSEAAKRGSYKYFTGDKCANGHISYRYTKTGGCAFCNNANSRKYSKALNAKLTQERVQLKIDCHREDRERIEQFVKALEAARLQGL